MVKSTVPLLSYQGFGGGGCDCGGEVVELGVEVGVEAVSHRGAVHRRVLTDRFHRGWPT